MRWGLSSRMLASIADAPTVGAAEINLPWSDVAEPKAAPSEGIAAQAVPDRSRNRCERTE